MEDLKSEIISEVKSDFKREIISEIKLDLKSEIVGEIRSEFIKIVRDLIIENHKVFVKLF